MNTSHTHARAEIEVAQGDLMIGELVLVETRRSTVTGRVAEVGDHSLWLYDHDSETTCHDRQWRALRRSVIGLEVLAPPVGWTRAEVDEALRLP
ncbi:hypothetical protein [Streptomyces sp. NPDC000931]|uniref:hypothetical protein n=1 Tax=Streptomyces sp. NPDC000931 TaxID=3154372 RepID=UPI0033242E19